MDPNERLLWRVVQERSGHGGLLGMRGGWLIFGALAIAVVVAVPVVRTMWLGSSDRPASPAADVSGLEGPAAPVAVPIVSSRATPVAPALTPGTRAPTRAATYVVQPGDNLQSIAARNGLRPATLASLNELDQPDLLQPGRSLMVPPTDGVVHVVEPGETLRTIAGRYGVDVGRIVSANELEDPDQIPVGLRLFIPTDNNEPE